MALLDAGVHLIELYIMVAECISMTEAYNRVYVGLQVTNRPYLKFKFFIEPWGIATKFSIT